MNFESAFIREKRPFFIPDFSTARALILGLATLQAELRAKGLPGERPKRLTAGLCAYDLGDLNFHLDRNGRAVQRGKTAQMSGKVNALIAYIPTFFTPKVYRWVISRAKTFSTQNKTIGIAIAL